MDWQNVEPPVDDWDRSTRLRNRLTRLTAGEKTLAVAVVGLVVVGILVSLVSIQARFGLLTLFSQVPGLLIGGGLVMVGLGVAAVLWLRIDRQG